MLVLAGGGLPTLAAPAPAAPGTAAVAPFLTAAGSEVVIDASIGGTATLRLQIDTGSTRTVLADDLARRLHLRAAGRTLLITPSGRARRGLVLVPALRIGGAVHTVVAMTVPRRDLAHRGAIDGILGQDVLTRQRVTLDYRRRQVEWRPPAAPGGGVRLELRREGGGLLVVVRGAGGAWALVPDSGAAVLVLFERRGRALPDRTPLETGTMRTVSGSRVVRRALIDRLRLGAWDLRGVEALVVRRGAGDDSLGDGLLPLHLFARVTLDPIAGYLEVEPR